MIISQTAGSFTVQADVLGDHVFLATLILPDDKRVPVHVADLHDLRYCIDRILAQLPKP